MAGTGKAGGSPATGSQRTQVKPGRAKDRGRPAASSQVRGHGPELAGLVCLGLSLYLFFVLAVGGGTGVVGRSLSGAMNVALGRLAFLFPAMLLGVTAMVMFEVKPRVFSAWAGGGVMCLLSVLLLGAGVFPPFGSAGDAGGLMREVYRVRTGWVGDVMYAGVSHALGSIGVAILGWLLLLAGISLLTGLTLRRAVTGTRRAATSMGAAAGRTTRRLRDGQRADDDGPLDNPYLSGFGPGVRPDLPPAEDDELLDETTAVIPASAWGAPRMPSLDRPAPDSLASRRLQDGAADFPDLYVDGDEPLPPFPSPARPSSDPSVPETDDAGSLGEEPAKTIAIDAALPPGGLAQVQSEVEMELGIVRVPDYQLPDVDLLRKSTPHRTGEETSSREVAAKLVETLSNFGVDANVIGMVVGPRVTRYELHLAPGTKVSKVSGLKDDLAYALASTEIRILAPIPGKSAVGVEVPNQRPDFVTLGDIYRDFPPTAGPLMVWLGKDISGKAVYTDLTKMPHLLIAGTTGSGKSGCINTLISSVLLRSTPEVVRMILIDPKKVELSHYERIPHLLVPVVTNMKNAAGVLSNLVREMDNRYELMELEHARHLDEMNKARRRRGEDPLPYILIVIDELADLMMVSPQEVEDYVIRLAQKARAVGLHLVVATQRPSADVITGMIKANIPSRIAFAVSSQTDSRVILDVNGAETLLGMGDMLFKPLGSSRLQRVQGAFITEEEIHMLVTHWRHQAQPKFREELLVIPERAVTEEAGAFDPDSDDLLVDAAELVIETGNASVSMLQRRLRVGYTRAGRLIDMLERRGVVGPYEGSKPRQLLVKPGERVDLLETLRSERRTHQPSLLDELEEP